MDMKPSLPDWYLDLVANVGDSDNPIGLSAQLDITRKLFDAPVHERRVVLADCKLRTWARFPRIERLACQSERPGTPQDRLRSVLILDSLHSDEMDIRDYIMNIAWTFHLCRAAGLDAAREFRMAAEVIEARADHQLRSFPARAPEDRSMDAFFFSEKVDANGELEIHPNW